MTKPLTQADWVLSQALIRDPTGLHARPAVKLTKLAKTFHSDIQLRADEQSSWVSAKSPNSVMKLKAAAGVPLHIRASGDDADDAVAALVSLIERDFND